MTSLNIVSAAVILLLSTGVSKAQNMRSVGGPEAGRSLSLHAVLDEIFHPNDEGAVLSLQIRFVPSFHPECQIDVLQHLNGKMSVTYSELDPAVSSALHKGLITDMAEALHAAPVFRRVWTSDTEDQRVIIKQFWAAVRSTLPFVETSSLTVAASGGERIELDGTEYLFRYVQGDTTVQLAYKDEETIDKLTGALPLTKWANSVRLSFLQRLPKKAKKD